MIWDGLIFLSSLCVIYHWRRTFCIKTQKFFFVLLLSVEAFLEVDSNEIWFGTFKIFFSYSFFSLFNLPLEKVILHKNTKKSFIWSFFSPWKLSLWQSQMKFDFGLFNFFSLSLSSLCVIYHWRRAFCIKTQIVFS